MVSAFPGAHRLSPHVDVRTAFGILPSLMLDEFIREYEAKWLDEPIPHSTVTRRGRPLTIPLGAAT